jgi:hypothetical protein
MPTTLEQYAALADRLHCLKDNSETLWGSEDAIRHLIRAFLCFAGEYDKLMVSVGAQPRDPTQTVNNYLDATAEHEEAGT